MPDAQAEPQSFRHILARHLCRSCDRPMAEATRIWNIEMKMKLVAEKYSESLTVYLWLAFEFTMNKIQNIEKLQNRLMIHTVIMVEWGLNVGDRHSEIRFSNFETTENNTAMIYDCNQNEHLKLLILYKLGKIRHW